MDYNNLAGDGGTDAMPQHVYQGLPSSSPFEYPADARDDFSTHSGTLSIPLSQPMAHGHVHYTVHHHSFMPLTLEHGTYGSMPNLHAHPHLTSSSSHGPLGLGAFESTTAASEYSYSDGYESGVTNEMSSRHSSYSPTSDVYSFPSAQTTQSYLNVGQHTGSSRSPGMSSRSLSDRRARPSSLSASPNLSYKVTKLPTPDHPSKAGSASVKKARSRKPFEPERRLEVRRMRQTGACFRCRWLKKPVSSDNLSLFVILTSRLTGALVWSWHSMPSMCERTGPRMDLPVYESEHDRFDRSLRHWVYVFLLFTSYSHRC